MTDAGPSHAEHLAFEVERAWWDDVTLVLGAAAAGRPPPLADVLARWWKRRGERLAAATTTLGDDDRAALLAALAGEPALVGSVRTAPTTVRAVALSRVRVLATRLRPLVELGAPAVVLAHQRACCAALLAALPPSAPWTDDPVPAIGLVPGEGDGGEAPDLHAWLDAMLRAAGAARPNLGLGPRFQAAPETARFLARVGVEPRLPRSWPGVESTAFSVWPDLDFWASPRIALPRRLEVPGHPPRVVVTESGGPVTVGVAGDRPPGPLAPALVARLASLSEGDALVSFVWLATDVAGPWEPF